jgi:hypothetical protein
MWSSGLLWASRALLSRVCAPGFALHSGRAWAFLAPAIVRIFFPPSEGPMPLLPTGHTGVLTLSRPEAGAGGKTMPTGSSVISKTAAEDDEVCSSS